MSDSMIFPAPPRVVKLTQAGVNTWNSYTSPGFNFPTADLDVPFAVKRVSGDASIYLLEYPGGHDLFISALECYGVTLNPATCEWEPIE